MNTRIVLALALMLATLAGCNTVEGIGRDISGGANAVRGWFSH
ncbi:MAG: entericidin [Rhodobacter sp.]|nr:entericidin [Paracoccaceae bacterium]MCB1410868.1 entericidin [Paracoccaceae bacterium]MCC0078780.1 entericidin [Rhodobacter sp.]